MGRREEKGRAVARYILGHSGIPSVSWEKGQNIEAPPPYRFHVTTSRSLDLFKRALEERIVGRINIVIRYDGDIPELEDAWVGMRLSEFVPLLQAHYEANRDRVETYRKGD